MKLHRSELDKRESELKLLNELHEKGYYHLFPEGMFGKNAKITHTSLSKKQLKINLLEFELTNYEGIDVINVFNSKEKKTFKKLKSYLEKNSDVCSILHSCLIKLKAQSKINQNNKELSYLKLLGVERKLTKEEKKRFKELTKEQKLWQDTNLFLVDQINKKQTASQKYKEEDFEKYITLYSENGYSWKVAFTKLQEITTNEHIKNAKSYNSFDTAFKTKYPQYKKN